MRVWSGGARRILLVPVVAAAALALMSGCTAENGQPQRSAVWPHADMERAVAQPAELIRWPYTGKPSNDPAAVNRRPLSVKIENLAAARPQLGLNSADVVYETVVEGGITRFNCIFQSSIPDKLGPVRSARLSDQWVVPQYQGLFFYSGRSHYVHVQLSKIDMSDIYQGKAPRAYYRVSDRFPPHNLLLKTSEAYPQAQRLGYSLTADLVPLQFSRRSPATSSTAEDIRIPFSGYNKVEWKYDSEIRRYRRWNSGKVHRDGLTGDQVAADNVVVLWATYTQAALDKHGGITWDIDLSGEGRASIFRGGQRLDGTWRADRTHPPRFTDASGRSIRLAPGRTWFQVVKTDTRITVK